MTDALYVADSPDTAWAEWYRWLSEGGLERAVEALGIRDGDRRPVACATLERVACRP